MKRVKKSLRAYQLLSSAFTAAIVVAAVALLSVAGASDAGNLTDAELFKSLSVVSGGFAIAYLGKHICTKNIQALERRIDRYIERRGISIPSPCPPASEWRTLNFLYRKGKRPSVQAVSYAAALP